MTPCACRVIDAIACWVIVAIGAREGGFGSTDNGGRVRLKRLDFLEVNVTGSLLGALIDEEVAVRGEDVAVIDGCRPGACCCRPGRERYTGVCVVVVSHIADVESEDQM